MVRARCTIQIGFRDPREADSVLEAISPDNLETPETIKIHSQVDGSLLTLRMESEAMLGTLIATLDDLLECIQAAERVLEEAKALDTRGGEAQ